MELRMSENTFFQADSQTCPVNPAILPEIMKDAPVGFFIATPDGKFLSVNRTLARMHGYDTPEEFVTFIKDIGMQIYADPSDRLRFRRLMDAQGGVMNNEYKVSCGDGSVRWISCNVRTSSDHNGNPVCEGFATDITERKCAEETLNEKNRLLQHISDNMFDLVVLTDLSGEVKFVSLSRNLLGYDPSSLIGRSVLELIHPDDLPEVASAFTKFIARQKVDRKVQYRYQCADGQYLWFETVGSLIVNEHGEPEEILFSTRDITESRQARKSLERNEAYLESVLRVSPIGIGVATDRVLITVNQKICEMTGYSQKELVGKSTRILYPDDADYEYVGKEKYARIRKHGTGTIETRFLRKDGKIVDVLLSSNPLDPDDLSKGVTFTALDITHRKQTEKALLQLNSTLEQQVVNRTALAESRSKQLQILAMELVEAEEKERKRIAEVLHDDLQQILASAKMQLQVACHALPPIPGLAEVDKLLKECITKSRRLSHELSPVVVYHSGLCTALKWLAGQLKEQFGLKVDLDLDTSQQFESKSLNIFLFRAVQELLFNVTKHAGVDSARVVLSVSDQGLNITVSDQGRGFNPEILDSTEKTGLGLLSLRERVQTMGGSLLLESVPGQGSSFVLQIPSEMVKTRKGRPWGMAGEQPISRKSRIGSTDKKGLRVIFVDDHKVMRQGLINLIAEQPGIRVVGEAANGREAIERVRQLLPDVVVIDTLMPEMDGEEATRRIKAEWPDVRIIGLSMLEDEHIAQAMKKAGAEAFLSKTVSPDELLKAIHGTIHLQDGRSKNDCR